MKKDNGEVFLDRMLTVALVAWIIVNIGFGTMGYFVLAALR